MQDKGFLMIPGPTPVPESVLLSMARHPVGHRTKDFSAVIEDVTEKLRWLHQTKGDVLTLATSGTGAMEASIVSALSPGDKVLVLVNGKFGDRWAKMAKAFQCDVTVLSEEWGKAIDPEKVKEALTTAGTYKAVIITHSETSTAVINDLETIVGYIQRHGALSIVDAVTSLGATPVPMDDWGLDFVATGSQKGYMMPPGLGFVGVSAKGWEAAEKSTMPRFYFDLLKYRKSLKDASTPFTPAINLIYAVQTALGMMQQEGLENIFARHHRHKDALRAGAKALGLATYVLEDKAAAPAVTAILPPEGVSADQMRGIIKKRYDIALAGGQDQLKDKIFRVGHLGFVSDRDVLTVLAAIEGALSELGHDLAPGAGVAAALKLLG
jgi:aspartate aminotransferase-like enzyme